MLHRALLLVTRVTALFGAVYLGFLLASPEGPVLWILLRGIAAFLVLATGAYILWKQAGGSPQSLPLKFTRSAGAVLVLVAVAGSMVTTVMGYLTGDFEYYLFMLYAAPVLQGGLLWIAGNRRHSPV